MKARLLRYLRPYAGRVLASIGCALGAAAGAGAYAFLAGPAVRALVQGGSLEAGPFLARYLPGEWLAALSTFVLGALPALIVLAALGKAFFSAGFNALLPTAVAKAASDLRRDLFARLVQGDGAFHSRRSLGDLVGRATGDVAAAESAASQVVITLIKDVAQALILLLVLAAIDLRLMVAAAVVIPGTLIPVRRFARRLREIGERQLEANAQVARRAEQTIFGHGVVVAFGGQAHERRRFSAANEALLSVMRTSLRWRAAYSPIMEGLGVLGLSMAVAYAGREVTGGRLAPEAIVSFGAAAMMLYQPLKALGNLGQQMAQLEAAAARIFSLLDESNEIEERPDARPLPPPREVSLRGVLVRYGEREALGGVDLDLRAGETVALVGESGAGKSTIVNLLLRFVDPSEGQVLFDGVDIREGTLASLRSHVGYVPQEPVLFAETVRENVEAGRALPPGAVERAAREANAHDFIQRMEDGYETLLQERAFNLSGGERQRICVARALAGEPRILVLDEATASLDGENDALLQEAFARALGGDRIGVIVSHRLASIRGVDRVVVLDSGRIVEEGPPAELLQRQGAFFRMWKQAA